jgi:hypothetical protein
VLATQTTSPWIVQAASTGVFAGFVVASIVGGGSTVTGSIWASQANTPWLIQATSTGAFGGFMVASVIGQPTVTASVIGAPTVVASIIGQPTVTASISGNVPVTQVTSPWIIQPGSIAYTVAQGAVVASVSGQVTVTASLSGQATVTASVIGQPTVTASIAGSVPVLATQTTSPWIVQQGSTGQFVGFVVASVIGGGSVITGSVWASQANTPWLTQATSSGVFLGFGVTSVIGQPTVTASLIGNATVIASIAGSVPVLATQTTSPWIVRVGSSFDVIGNVNIWNWTSAPLSYWVSQANSPWMTQPGSTGAFQGFVVASVIGAMTVTGSVYATTAAAGTFTLAKIAWEVRSHLPYPYDGAGMCRSVSATTTTLASDVLSSDLSGLRLFIVSSGPAMGQSVLVTGWDAQASQRVSHAAWGVTPASGQSYVLLLDTTNKSNLQVRAEVASSTAKVHFTFGLWAAVQSGNLGLLTAYPQNVPRPAMDTSQIVNTLPTSFGIAVPSYWPAEVKQVNATGYIGAKVYVTSAMANFSLWGGAV